MAEESKENQLRVKGEGIGTRMNGMERKEHESDHGSRGGDGTETTC